MNEGVNEWSIGIRGCLVLRHRLPAILLLAVCFKTAMLSLPDENSNSRLQVQDVYITYIFIKFYSYRYVNNQNFINIERRLAR